MTPARVVLHEVGPRDGLQNEEKHLDPETRGELVNRLAAAGLPRIEAVSFVAPERVPQMAGAEEVVAAAGAAETGRGLEEQAANLAAGLRETLGRAVEQVKSASAEAAAYLAPEVCQGL